MNLKFLQSFLGMTLLLCSYQVSSTSPNFLPESSVQTAPVSKIWVDLMGKEEAQKLKARGPLCWSYSPQEPLTSLLSKPFNLPKGTLVVLDSRGIDKIDETWFTEENIKASLSAEELKVLLSKDLTRRQDRECCEETVVTISATKPAEKVLPNFVKKCQTDCKVIGITDTCDEPIGIFPNWPDKRIPQLQRCGFHLENSWTGIPKTTIGCGISNAPPSVFQDGVLFCDAGVEEEVVLEKWLTLQSLKPKAIVFIANSNPNFSNLLDTLAGRLNVPCLTIECLKISSYRQDLETRILSCLKKNSNPDGVINNTP